MSDATSAVKSLRERLAGAGEDHLGRALSDLLDNPLLTGTIGRAFDAREKAVQAQELAMGALNIPSAADIERLTRRLRSVSQRLEGIEDGVHRLDRALSVRGVDATALGERLSKIEAQLGTLSSRLSAPSPSGRGAPARPASPKSSSPKSASSKSASSKSVSSKPTSSKSASPKSAATAAAKPRPAKPRPAKTGSAKASSAKASPAKAGAAKSRAAKRSAAKPRA